MNLASLAARIQFREKSASPQRPRRNDNHPAFIPMSLERGGKESRERTGPTTKAEDTRGIQPLAAKRYRNAFEISSENTEVIVKLFLSNRPLVVLAQPRS